MFEDELPKMSRERRAELDRQRRRSDKVSSLMGEYLLKGWRMLGESCTVCDAVMLMNRDGELYCVGCSEVDKMPEFCQNQPKSRSPILNGSPPTCLTPLATSPPPCKASPNREIYPRLPPSKDFETIGYAQRY
uniref:Sjogrens syndrome scleroderma autoantigen 1 n=1 Tax=Mesocestoides corti TaxID=53468 RepID=A0A5K3FED8_MESCO